MQSNVKRLKGFFMNAKAHSVVSMAQSRLLLSLQLFSLRFNHDESMSVRQKAPVHNLQLSSVAMNEG